MGRFTRTIIFKLNDRNRREKKNSQYKYRPLNAEACYHRQIFNQIVLLPPKPVGMVVTDIFEQP